MKKRLMSVLLIICMTAGILSFNASADERDYFCFSDVSRSSWYHDSLELCYANGILSGISDNKFGPLSGTTREQMMVVLNKISQDSIAGEIDTPFEDVNPDSWYASYVNWAYDKGYTKGVSDKLFGIGRELTREEAVTLIYNYSMANSLSEPSAPGNLGNFADSENVSVWAQPAFGWAVFNSLVKGDNNGLLNPRAAVKRAELSVMISAFLEKIVYGNCEHVYIGADDCSSDIICRKCSLIKKLPKEHEFVSGNCVEVSYCKYCNVVVLPVGHSYSKASCDAPMTCTVCGAMNGSALGHTTDNGVCARCNKEVFADNYSKFVYHMTHSAMSDGNMRYLFANVTHADGNTSKQYVRYDTKTGISSIEILFSFSGNDHTIRTIIEFSEFSSLYVARSEYRIGGDVYSTASANIYSAYINKDQYVELSSYSGNAEQKNRMRTLVKNSVLLSIDSTDHLLSSINMSVEDMGFTAFN